MILQLASRYRSRNGAQKAVIARPVSRKMSGKTPCNSTTESTLAFRCVRVIRCIGVLWRITLLLLLLLVWVIGVVVWLLLLTVLRLLLGVGIIASLILRWSTTAFVNKLSQRVENQRRLTSNRMAPGGCWSRMLHIARRLVHAGTLRAAVGHTSSHVAEVHIRQVHRHIVELVEDSHVAAVDYTVVIGRTEGNLAEERNSSGGTGCKDLTCLSLRATTV